MVIYDKEDHLKGEIDFDMLLTSNDLIQTEIDLRNSFPKRDYKADGYKKAGISEMKELKKELWK